MPASQKHVKSVRFDIVYLEILEKLTPFYGSTPAEVIRNIVLIWLQENIGGDTFNELQKIGAIHLEKDKQTK